jgi:hypothetical protein
MLHYLGSLNTGAGLLQIQAVSSPGSVWTQILTALVIGLLTAFALQVLLTSVGLAVGISLWKVTADDRSTEPDEQIMESGAGDGGSSDRAGSSLGWLAGLGILFTVNTVLFAASFLAATFSQASDPLSGAIEGVVIWSAYFLLLLWLSSTAMTSVVGAVLGATTGGIRQLITTIAAALNGREETTTEQQIVTLHQDIQEMQALLDPEHLRQLIETQLQTLPPDAGQPSTALLSTGLAPRAEPSVWTPTAVAFWQQMEPYLHDASPKDLAPKRLDRQLQQAWQIAQSDAAGLSDRSTELQQQTPGDRRALQAILDQRDDLSQKKQARILTQLSETWTSFQETEDFSRDDRVENGEEPEESPQPLTQLTTKLLQSASDASLDQLLTNLPSLLQWLKTALPDETPSLVPVILSIALDKIRRSVSIADDAPKATAANSPADAVPAIDYAALKHALDRLLDGSQAGLSTLNQSLITQMEQWRDRSMQQVDSLQQSAQARIDAVKQQTQQRLEETRKAAAAAAWWLVLTASTGALSAALAGALAAGFEPMDLLP